MFDILEIGVVGYCPPTKFDEQAAKSLLNGVLDDIMWDYCAHSYRVVSGLVSVGIPGLAYRIAKEREWGTAGVACRRVYEHPIFEVDEGQEFIVGKKWGDESDTFLKKLAQNGGVLVRIGGGAQSHDEVARYRRMSPYHDIRERDLAAL